MTKCFSIFFFVCLGVHLNAYQKRNIDHCRGSPKVAVGMQITTLEQVLSNCYRAQRGAVISNKI